MGDENSSPLMGPGIPVFFCYAMISIVIWATRIVYSVRTSVTAANILLSQVRKLALFFFTFFLLSLS